MRFIEVEIMLLKTLNPDNIDISPMFINSFDFINDPFKLLLAILVNEKIEKKW